MGGVLFQVLTAVTLHYNCLNFGVILALPSTTLLIFKSENTTLDRPLTDTEGSLLSSLPSIGALISTPISGMLMNRLGRKKCAIMNSSIGALSWSILAVTNRVELALAASLISGASAAIFLVVPVFVSEISEVRIRGTLTAGAVPFYGMGMLVSFIMGEYLVYKTLVFVCLSMSVVGVALLMILKESPMCLMQKGLEEEAAKSMAFYRGEKPNSKLVMDELDNIRRMLSPETEVTEITPEEEKLTRNEKEDNGKKTEQLSCWQFFKRSRSTRRAFMVTMTCLPFAIFQGMGIVQVYAKPLFSEAVPAELLSPTWCSVLLAVVSVISGLVTAFLTDVAGRRTLMMWGSLLSAICCLLLGSQIHVHWGPHWLTAALIYVFAATFTMGAGTVPFLLLAELFLPEVRGVASMLVMEWMWTCSFVALFIFTPMVAAIGLGPVFYFFASVCVISAVFCFFFIPETKGLPIDAIQLLLAPKKNELV